MQVVKTDSVCVCVPVGRMVQDWAPLSVLGPATLVQSFLQPGLHHWPHSPVKDKCTSSIPKTTRLGIGIYFNLRIRNNSNLTWKETAAKSKLKWKLLITHYIFQAFVQSTSYWRPPPRASRSRWMFFSKRSEPRGLGCKNKRQNLLWSTSKAKSKGWLF